jgi:sarcosine oxidase subunit gamma
MDRPASPLVLDDSTIARDGFDVFEKIGLGLIRLQVFSRKADAVVLASERLGMSLPNAGKIATRQQEQWFWSAPGEWLIAVPEDAEMEVVNSLRAKLDGLFAVLSVITDSQVVLELSGQCLREVLARGSTVDLHPSRFGEGQCLNTRFAAVSVMLACPGAADPILLFADRTVATYLNRWLRAASADC